MHDPAMSRVNWAFLGWEETPASGLERLGEWYQGCSPFQLTGGFKKIEVSFIATPACSTYDKMLLAPLAIEKRNELHDC